MFSISKNDVSEFLKKEKNTDKFYGSFFSFFPLPPIHLVIPMESRELGATRDLVLQALHSHSVSHSVLLPLPALQRPLALYSCSLLSSPCASALPCDLSPPTLQRSLAQYSCSILNHEGYPLNFNI